MKPETNDDVRSGEVDESALVHVDSWWDVLTLYQGVGDRCYNKARKRVGVFSFETGRAHEGSTECINCASIDLDMGTDWCVVSITDVSLGELGATGEIRCDVCGKRLCRP